MFGVVFALLVVVLVQRLFTRFGPSDVRATVRTYQVVDDSRVLVTIDLTRDPARDALCLLRSRDRLGSEVGHTDLRVASQPGGAGQINASATISTSARAVTAEVTSCLPLQPGAPVPFPEPATSPAAVRPNGGGPPAPSRQPGAG